MASKTTTDSTFNQIARKGSKLNQFVAQSKKIIGDEVATRVLTAAESGADCLFDLASGTTYTLPLIERTEQIGMYFTFKNIIRLTSVANKVITKDIVTEFLLGNIFMYSTDVTESDSFDFDGTANAVAISSTNDATGGALGGVFKVTAISLTQWFIEGHLCTGSTAPTTPVSAS